MLIRPRTTKQVAPAAQQAANRLSWVGCQSDEAPSEPTYLHAVTLCYTPTQQPLQPFRIRISHPEQEAHIHTRETRQLISICNDGFRLRQSSLWYVVSLTVPRLVHLANLDTYF